MEHWFTEQQTPNVGLTCKTIQTLHSEKTEFQSIEVIDTVEFGRMLVIDGMIMTTIKDEFVYHEMLTHVPLNTHPNPKKVLVVGGGDGGTIREIIKHSSVERATLCEIDDRVMEISKEYFPEVADELQDLKVEVLIADGVKHIKERENFYDIILIDSTEPVGPAKGLFALEFYQDVYRALKEDGLMAAQTESPWFNSELLTRVTKDIASVFPIMRLYYGSVPTYPSGLWTWTIGSKKYDPLSVDENAIPNYETRYYTPRLHKTVFELPKFIAELVNTQ